MISLLSNKLKSSRDLKVEVQKDLYLSGEELVGRVHFTPKKSVHLSLVKIYFCGEEFCAWTERIAMRTGAQPTPGDIKLFRKEQALVQDRTRFQAGNHTWNFRFMVPRDIPPSCIYKRGQACVAYFLKVKACTGFGHFDMVYIFPVIIGQLWIPVRPVAIYNTYNGSGGSTRIQAIATHSVAKCDENVGVHVEIENNGNRQIEGIRLKLKQVWECSEVFHHKNVICKVDCKEGFPVGRGQQTRDLQINIPSYLIVVPTISNGHLFKCSYYIGVYLIMKLGGVLEKERVKCHIPIIISNMPIEQNSPHSTPPSRNSLRRSQSHDVPVSQETFNTEMDRMMANFQDLLSPSVETRERGESSSNNNARVLERRESSPAVVSERSNYNPFTNPQDDEETTPAVDLTSDDLPKNECIICFDGPKNMLVLPCAHIATCSKCTAHIMKTTRKCPVCRGAVTQVLKTYQV